MHSSVATAPPFPETRRSEGDQAVDDLADAVVTLLRTWRCLGKRGPESARSGLATLETTRLLGHGEHRLSELAELRGVDQSVISRQIGELEAQHLVCRRPDPSDRRATLVRLTPEGAALLERARSTRRLWLRDALAHSPAVDVRTAALLITALAEELAAHAAHTPPDPAQP